MESPSRPHLESTTSVVMLLFALTLVAPVRARATAPREFRASATVDLRSLAPTSEKQGDSDFKNVPPAHAVQGASIDSETQGVRSADVRSSAGRQLHASAGANHVGGNGLAGAVLAGATASAVFHDFVFSGPGAEVSARLNLALDGIFFLQHAQGSLAPVGAQFRYDVSISDQATGLFTFGGGVLARLTTELTITPSGPQFPYLFDPEKGEVEFLGTLESVPFQVPTGIPLTFQFGIGLGADAFSGHALTSFINTFGFPVDGPAFTLPPGYTVNSAQAGLRDNRFVPEAPALCAPTPAEGCLAATKASLSVKEGKAGSEKLKASLKGFELATMLSDFGDPVGGTTAYDLCVYDDQAQLVTALGVRRGGQSCGARQKSCWKAKGGKGWSYRDPDSSADGVKKLSVTSGAEGKGKLQLLAGNRLKKNQFSLPAGTASALEGAEGATLQVRASDGSCFGAALGTVKKSDGEQFKATKP